MKPLQNRWGRVTALVLSFCLLFLSAVLAAGTEEYDPTQTQQTGTGAELTDEELIEQYRIPDSWSRDALLFAVRNGLLCGSGDGTLNPSRTATRAELATILSGALPTRISADLTVFYDLTPTAWYYHPLSHAAAMGLISGTGDGKMSPNGPATREQAIAMIAKAFGLTESERSVLTDFEDWIDVSQWAVPSMSAMVKAGYVAGAGGCLNPKRAISREEFAQIIYSIVDRFVPQPEPESAGMTVTYADQISPQTVVKGDLLICNDAEELVLDRVTVTGRLILQGAAPLRLTVENCSVSELILCRPTEAELDGSADKVTVTGDTVLHGNAELVVMAGGDLTIATDASVDKVLVKQTAEGSTLTVDGALREAEIKTVITLKGSGTVQSAEVHAPSFAPELEPETVSFTEDHGLTQLEVKAEPSGMPAIDEPVKTVTLSFGGMLPQASCDIYWYLDGKCLYTDSGVTLTEDLRLAHSIDFSGDFNTYSNRQLRVALVSEEQGRSYAFKIPIKLTYLMYELSDVRTLDIPATVNYTANLYSDMGLSNVIGSVAKGTIAIYKAYRDQAAAKLLLPDGRLGWVRYDAITISNKGYYTGKDYTAALKEAWVNAQGYSSETDYLVWCNLYTQRVNIFQGTKGEWKLVYSSRCATGTNYTPTPQEVTKIFYKTNQWRYSYYYVHHVSVFDNSRGFHSMLYRYDSYTLYDNTMGCPASHGCVRMPDDGILYIWNKVPVNSTVVIY